MAKLKTMTPLLDGHQYSLCTENNNNKSVIFVKLTDSAIQAIETYLKSKDDSSCKPTIQVKDNNGTISIPLEGRPHNYAFTLSNTETVKGQQNCFQCYQHVNNYSSLESLGFFHTKMQIHASDDIYEKTKSKMTAADEKQKKLCTKELQSVSRVGNKASVKRRGLQRQVLEKASSNVLKYETAKQKLENKETSSSALMQQPIRKRIIHILAAKQYKRVELQVRLINEGINDKDKEQINDVLAQVAKDIKGHPFAPNQNQILTLEDRIWSEVQDDWEFSSNEELQTIIKRKKLFLKPDVGVTNLPKSANKKKAKSEKKQQYSSLFQNVYGQNSKSPVEQKLLSNGTLKASEAQPAITSKMSTLQLSFVPQESRKGKTNIKREEETPMDASNGDGIGQHFNPMSCNTVSKCKQQEQSKTKVKKSSNSEKTLSILEKIRSVQQRIKEDSLLQSYKNVDMKGNGNDRSNSAVASIGKSEVASTSKSEVAPTVKSEVALAAKSDVAPVAQSEVPSAFVTVAQSEVPSAFVPVSQSEVPSAFVPAAKSVPVPEVDLSEIRKKRTKVETLEQRKQLVEETNKDYEEYVKLRSIVKEASERMMSLGNRIRGYRVGSSAYKRINILIKKENERYISEGYDDIRKRHDFLKAKFEYNRKIVEDFDESL